MERPEKKFTGCKNGSYITRPFGVLTGFVLNDLQLVCQLHSFQTRDGTRNPSKNFMSLNGVGEIVHNNTIGIADLENSSISRIPICIERCDEAELERPHWLEQGIEGWICKIGAQKGERDECHSWWVQIYLGQEMFDQILYRYQHKTLASLYIVVKTDLVIAEIDKWSESSASFLTYDADKIESPNQAIGTVENITFSEPKFTFQQKAESETSPQDPEKSFHFVELKNRIQQLEERMQQIATPKKAGWLR
jgi:hypothetical protein